jgi:biopolymer transport protein ExbB
VPTLHELLAALSLGGAMVYPLLALAVLATVIVLEKGFVFAHRTRLPASTLDLVETYGFAWDDLERELARLGRRNCFRRFFAVILDNTENPAWWVESRAADEASLIEKSLGSWLWVLETIVTAAPLLGLLGTITGMIRAFKLFGDQGLVDPAGVTGGVAEALIATALGLLIALVALFAFNYFSQRQAQVMDEIERLGTRLVDHIRLDKGATEPSRPAGRLMAP